jgi:hypothetical protein
MEIKKSICSYFSFLSASAAMSKSALVILAQGAEEMETVITVDMLRRGGVSYGSARTKYHIEG